MAVPSSPPASDCRRWPSSPTCRCGRCSTAAGRTTRSCRTRPCAQHRATRRGCRRDSARTTRRRRGSRRRRRGSREARAAARSQDRSPPQCRRDMSADCTVCASTPPAASRKRARPCWSAGKDRRRAWCRRGPRRRTTSLMAVVLRLLGVPRAKRHERSQRQRDHRRPARDHLHDCGINESGEQAKYSRSSVLDARPSRASLSVRRAGSD